MPIFNDTVCPDEDPPGLEKPTKRKNRLVHVSVWCHEAPDAGRVACHAAAGESGGTEKAHGSAAAEQGRYFDEAG